MVPCIIFARVNQKEGFDGVQIFQKNSLDHGSCLSTWWRVLEISKNFIRISACQDDKDKLVEGMKILESNMMKGND